MRDAILCDAVADREEFQKNANDFEMLKKVEKLKSEFSYSAKIIGVVHTLR